uniref:Uncharacterized protein n=1 Tax=uncultured bacterium contig00013 TaxID=1181504 RepID=A0A806K0R5_9BACT|nr:hypothetical protein [uncultured bacterium contig00013]
MTSPRIAGGFFLLQTLQIVQKSYLRPNRVNVFLIYKAAIKTV